MDINTRKAKSPYARHNKREFLYSETTRACIKAVKDGQTDTYDKLTRRVVRAMLLAQARRGIEVWRWPGLSWTRNDDRFRDEYAVGRQERASHVRSLSPSSA